ncbi:fused MFS/spermidine synthase [Microbacterium sp. STN6]|uniref:spermidine synthase n=1 Tax=Microbacterium sp. STN6 TaxID=2995588 RepID=UPI00226081C8|nr:fused MFS/spermidine synthase [Microbacterium sp. STN6]MCX7522113.1 fused MFS/spermidine synthase [Microbacterium sp. STN6]
MQSAAVVRLETERVSASIVPGRGTNGGCSLVIDGMTQSHVNLANPRDLQLEYVRSIAAIVDAAFSVIRPVNALHLGGGALTVPRYIAATRPDSSQRVVELHAELLEFVLEHLPLNAALATDFVIGDARDVVEARREADAGAWDLVVVDVFSGSVAPRHVSTAEFYSMVRGCLAPGGVVIVNTLTTQGLDFTRDALVTLQSLFANVTAIAPEDVVDGARGGNVVIAASDRPLDQAGIAAHLATTSPGAGSPRVFATTELAPVAATGVVRRDGDDLEPAAS